MFADELLQRDKSKHRIDFTKKQRDVSYLMETRKYTKEKSINQYISRRVNKSIHLLSPDISTITHSLHNHSRKASVKSLIPFFI